MNIFYKIYTHCKCWSMSKVSGQKISTVLIFRAAFGVLMTLVYKNFTKSRFLAKAPSRLERPLRHHKTAHHQVPGATAKHQCQIIVHSLVFTGLEALLSSKVPFIYITNHFCADYIRRQYLGSKRVFEWEVGGGRVVGWWGQILFARTTSVRILALPPEIFQSSPNGLKVPTCCPQDHLPIWTVKETVQ